MKDDMSLTVFVSKYCGYALGEWFRNRKNKDTPTKYIKASDVIKVVEKQKIPDNITGDLNWDAVDGWNQALDDVIKAIGALSAQEHSSNNMGKE